ncbi:Uncharacterised protein [Clostridium putrefaciens]|uniref:Uncharacterized protein n=1 Tax=Clostridium putrefaciens TaxID=99675 RepID=A0A381J9D1_9CLOT|nr:hypothetical protein [Clostridium putrefaciens]SUY47844.1 Uncharacterised protein [Clostridium putrefaciens]
MGKKKRKDYDREVRQPEIQNDNGNYGGMNPMMSMLNNVDMNKLSTMLGLLNSNGTDLGNLNIADLIGTMNNQGVPNNTTANNTNNNAALKSNNQIRRNIDINVGNEAIVQLLNSLKPFLGDRSDIIDNVIDIYLSEDD